MVTLKESAAYLLAGTEQFLKQENLAKLKSACLDKNSADFNFNSFYAGTNAAKEVLECACTAPFFGGRRVVVVYSVDDFSTSDKQIIISYLKRPHKFTLLILETAETKLNQGFLRDVSRLTQVVLCKPLKGPSLFSWIDKRVASYNKKIEVRARNLLAENLNNKLELILNSLESLNAYTGKRGVIETSDVEKLVGLDVTTSAFELSDQIRRGSKCEALKNLNKLLYNGVNSSQILGGLTYKLLMERHKLPQDKFKNYLSALQTADQDIKEGKKSQRIALEILAVYLLGLF